MKVAGIDVSTKAIDLVLLNLDDDHAEWQRFPLGDGELIDRVMQVRDWLHPANSLWDDIIAVGIERPAGRYSVDKVAMVVGAVLCRIPAAKLTRWWMPAEWKKACGLPGNSNKNVVRAFVAGRWVYLRADWPDDACDAYVIAYATRAVIEQVKAA